MINSYPVARSLSLSKETEGTKPSNAPETCHTMTVEIFGTSTLDISAYGDKITWTDANAAGTKTAATNGTYDSSNNKYTISVVVEANGSEVSVSGIPDGAKYTVVEAAASQTGTITNGVKYKLNNAADFSPTSIGASTPKTIGSSNTVVVKNIYPGTSNSLVLQKVLGANASAHGVQASATFDYYVEFSGPTGYTLAFKDSHNEPVTPTENNGVYKISVSQSNPVTISGIPDGTTYTLYEDTSSLPSGTTVKVTGSSNPVVYVTSSAKKTGSISGTTTVSLTNDYPEIGSLVLKKTVSGTNWPVGTMPATYEYTVTLTDPYDTGTSSYTADLSTYGITVSDDTNIGSYSSHGYSFTVNVAPGNTGVTINHLPINTKYTVTETTPSPANGTKSSVTVDGAAIGTAGADVKATGDQYITNDTTNNVHTAVITNTYPETGSLVLQKGLDGAWSANGISNSTTTPTEFTYEVILTPPTGMSLDTFVTHYIGSSNIHATDATAGFVYVDSNNDGINDKLKRRYTVPADSIAGRANENTNVAARTISNLPVNTGFTVEEVGTNDKKKTSNVVGYPNNDNGKATGTTTAGSNTAIITNTYPELASLVVTKAMADGTQKENGESFKFHVVLENNDVDLTHFVGSSFFSSYEIVTPTGNDYQSNHIAFDLNLVLNGTESRTLTGLPKGTSYTITEELTTTPTTGQVAQGWKIHNIHYSNGNQTTTTAQTKTLTDTTNPEEVTFYNAKIGKLVLDKELVSGTDANGTYGSSTFGQEKFTYEVELKAPTATATAAANIDLKTYLPRVDDNGTITLGGKTVKSCAISDYTATQIKFTVEVAANDTNIEFDNIPYGTTYKVTEDTHSDSKWVKYGESGTHGAAASDYLTVGSRSQTASFTNGYTGSLTVQKTLTAGAPDYASNTDYAIVVTMNAPANTTIDWSKYSYSISDGTFTRNGNELSFTLKGSGTGSKKIISGIPYGVTCTVSETVQSGAAYSATTPAAGVTVSSSTGGATADLTVENTYSDTCQLTLAKAINNYPDNASVAETDKTFPFVVKLTQGSVNIDWSNVTFESPAGTAMSKPTTFMHNGSSVNTFTSGDTFTVNVKKGTNVVIKGLPLGTQYEVYEDITAATGSTVSGAAITGGAGSYAGTIETYETNNKKASGELSTTNGKNQTVTITNDYKVTHSLTLNKVENHNNTTSVPSGSTYTFTVTFGSATINGITLGSEPYRIYMKVGNDTAAPITSFTNPLTIDMTPGTAVVLSGIPDGVTYTVTETGIKRPDSSTETYANLVANAGMTTSVNGTSNTNTTGEQTLNADDTVTITNTYKEVGRLKLKKVVNGGTNAGVDGTTEFIYKVELTEPTGVTFDGNYTITGTSGITSANYDSGNKKYTFYETVTANTPVVISGIPYGSTYEITEVYGASHLAITNDPKHPAVSYDHKTGEIGKAADMVTENAGEANEVTLNRATVTNTYRKIILTKSDSKDSDVKVQNAVYSLWKLHDGVDVTGAYAAASDATTLATFCDRVLDTSGNNFTATTNASGQITVKDADVQGGLTPGKYVFLEDSISNGNYTINSAPKTAIIEISSANDTLQTTHYVYTVAHDDPRKTGTLDLNKLLETGIDADATYSDPTTFENAEFTYSVELNGSTAGLDLSDYGIALEGTAISSANYNSATKKYTFTVDVKANDAATAHTITGIPYGTTYTVTEVPKVTDNNWKQTDSSYTTGTITTGSDTVTASFTNGYVCSIQLKKTVEGTPPSNVQSSYPFKVTLTSPTGNFTGYTITAKNGSDANANLSFTSGSAITSGQEFTVNVPKYTGSSDIITISGLPYGTTYSIYEDSQNDGSVSNHTNTNGTNGIITNTLTNASVPVAEITNTYKNTGILTLEKTIDNAGGTRPVGVPNGTTSSDAVFTFRVTLSDVPNGAVLCGSNTTSGTTGYYIQKSTDGGSTYTTVDTVTQSGSTYYFDVEVPQGGSVKLRNIPYDTTYKVEELAASQAGTASVQYKVNDAANWNTDDQSTDGVDESAFATGTIHDSEKVTVQNSYPKVGDLVLEKEVLGSRPGGALTSYPFNVTLTAPGTVSLNNYTLTWKKGETTYTSYTAGSGNSSDNTTHTYTVQVPSDGSKIIISGIPYGTTYSVSEPRTGDSYAGNPSIGGEVSNKEIGKNADMTNLGTEQSPDMKNYVKITNAYSGLVLSKALGGSYSAHDVTDSNTLFTYHVSLTHGTDVLSGLSIVNAASTTYDSNGSNANDFQVSFYANKDVTISGMPSGTSFAVYEVTSSLPSGMSYGYSGGSVTGTLDDSHSQTVEGTVSSSGATTVEITNTYPDAGNLKLIKHQSNSDKTNAHFKVTLYIPVSYDAAAVANQNIKLNDAAIGFTSGPETATVGSVNYNKYIKDNITVPVTTGTTCNVEIKHLPVGTIYQVEELQADWPDGNRNNVSDEVTDTAHSIVSGASTVTITNTYPEKGSLVLKKDLGTYAGANGIQNTTGFTFEVTLTPPSASGAGGMTLDTFIANYLGTSAAATLSEQTAYDNGTDTSIISTKFVKVDSDNDNEYDQVKKRFTVTKQQSDGASPETISGLPVGTTYTVEEVGANDKKKTTSVVGSSNNSNGKATGNLAAGSNNAVITNNYPQVGELVVTKSITNNISGFTPTEFDIDVTLVPPTSPAMTVSKFKEFISTPYEELPDSTDPTSVKKTLHVTSSDLSATISGLPVGTTYTVSEQTASKVKTSSVTYEVNGSTGNSGSIVAAANGNAATVTNTYPDTGSLKLRKAYEHGSEESSSKTSFLYQVVLTNSSLSSWDDYDHNTVGDHTIGLSTGNFVTSTGADITTSTDAVGTVSGSTYTFYVKVTNGTDVTISNIPENTTYTVTEMKPLPNAAWSAVSGKTDEWTNGTTVWKQVGAVSYQDDSANGTDAAQKIESGETDTATITNARISDLTFKKEIDGNTALKPNDNKFNFTVKLTPPAGMTVAQLKAYSSDLSDFTPVTPSGQSNPTYLSKDVEVTYNSTLANNIGTTLRGLPYGTKFDVVETDASKAKTETVGYKLNSEGSFSPSLTADSEIGTSNLVTVKNTYPSLGQLILSKDMAAGTDDTSTYFIYKVVLNRKSGTTTDLQTFAITADKNLVTSAGADASSITAESADTCTFYVKVKKGENVTISGIPQGTTYTVTEEKPLEDGWNTTPANTVWTSTDGNSMWKKVGQTNKIGDTNAAYEITSSSVTNTITNQKFGSLTITKTVTGKRPANKPNSGNTETAAAPYIINVTIGTAALDLTYDSTKVSHTSGNAYTVTLSAYKDNDDSTTIKGIPYGTAYTVAEQSSSGSEAVVTYKLNSVDASETSINNTVGLTGNDNVIVKNAYAEPRSLKLNKTLGTNAANYGAVAYTPASGGQSAVNGTEFTYKVKLTHASLSGYTLTVKGAKNPDNGNWEDYNITNPTSGDVITITLQAGKEVTIENVPENTEYEVYEDTANLPNGTTQSITGSNPDPTVTDDPTNGKTASGTIGSTAATVTITNNYGSVGTLTLNKKLTADTPQTSGYENLSQEFVYEVTLNAPTNAKLNQSVYTVTAGKMISVTQTPANGLADQLKYTVKVSKNTPVEISGLPYGTEFSVSEKTSGTYTVESTTYNYMPDGWKYIKDEYGTTNQTDHKHYIGAEPEGDDQPRNTYTAYNAQLNTLTLSKELASGSDGQDEGQYIYGAETFPYSVTLVTPTGVQISDGITLTTTGASPTAISPTPTVNYVQTTSGDNAPYTTITFTVNVTKNQSVAVNGIPYGTTFSVSESKDGWKKVGEAYGNTTDSKHYIGTSGNTYTASNAKVNNLTLEKALADGTPSSENSKLFLYEVKLKAPSGMQFRYDDTNHKLYIKNSTNGVESEITIDPNTYYDGTQAVSEVFYNNAVTISNDSGTNNKATFKVHVQKYRDGENVGSRIIKNLPYGTVYTVTEDEEAFPTAPTGTQWRNLTATAQSDTIGSSTYTATLTNGLFTSLTLKKDFVDKPFNVTDNTVFRFDVTLTKEGLTKVTVDGTEKTLTSGTAFSIDVSKNAPVTITDIPVGTTCLVEETAASQSGVKSVSYHYNDTPAGTTNVTLNSSTNTAQSIVTPMDVTVTNTYQYVNKVITLFKRDAETGEGIPGAQFYLLRLADGLDITDENVQNTFKTGSLNASGELKYGDTVLATVVAGITGAGTGGVLTTQSNPDDTQNNGDEDHAAGNLPVTENPPTLKFQSGDRYFFFENTTDNEGTTILAGTTPVFYKADNTITEEKVITILDNQDYYSVTYDNERTPTSKPVEIEKQDKTTGEKLGGATFELWYKNVEIPTTYTVNNAANTPDPLRATGVTGTLTVPDPSTDEYKTPDTPTYSYSNPTVPSAEEVEWILPRTDNDYIYFRDYNDAIAGDTGTQDHQSFNEQNQDSRKQTDNRSWIYTTYETNTHGQDEEINYNHDYWVAAWFSGPGKETVRYSVWERFLDTYTTGEDTVIWKIQPPDGYTKVRFGLYKNGNCIRTTEEFKFKLGTVYHKTSYGNWKRENGNECYFDAPVVGEKYWSTYYDKSGTADKRQNYSSLNSAPNIDNKAPQQADRYTPTEQKIVFHCNSKVVWHNIHIEFFGADGTTPVGQSFPGYLMEPYAYAGSDYRINGYLTYELTIPKEASYFRVNNGVDDSGHYVFKSEITPLLHIEGRKNYGNYFSINGASNAQVVNPYNGNANTLVHLAEWTDYTATGDWWAESYDSVKLDSDSDFVYFEKPADWNDHVYAYFYGGGDLRKDNWQRATYSVWPGVAPVSTEYVEKGANGTVTGTYHSDTYTYTYNNSDAGLYSTVYGTASDTPTSLSNPESTFVVGTGVNAKTIYKFRIPKGERKNYSKVIFNDGLSSQGGTNETGVIPYSSGHLYDKDGNDTGYYYNKPTYDYTKRGTGDDYIYIRVSDDTWDNMHIRFYDSNDRAILQDKSVSDTTKGGYVMEYSGKDETYKYFRIPIPENAAQFSLNNGRDSDKSTGKYEILRLDTNGDSDNTANDYTEDRMIFTLNTTNNTLDCVGPVFTAGAVIPGETVTTGQNAHIDYTVRQSNGSNDTLNIRDTAGWNLGTETTAGEDPATTTTISAGSIKFYDENGQLIRGSGSDGNGTYTLIKTNVESSEQNTAYTSKAAWYTIGIPENAKTFTVSYTVSTKVGDNDPTIQNVKTPAYEIYPYGAQGTEADHTESGNMYYETTSNSGQLQLISGTVENLNPYTEPSYDKRGDDLYLVCADRSAWDGMTVTFTFEDNSTITASANNVQYLNYVSYEPLNPVAGVSTSDMNEVGYWFRVAIPKKVTGEAPNQVTTTPTSFTAVKDDNSSTGAIFRLTDTISRYDNDYTNKDMMYRLPNANGKPKLIYPVYTKEEVQSVEVGGETIYSQPTVKANERAVADYAKAEAAKLPESDGTSQDAVLYETDSKDITTTWTVTGVSNPDYAYIKLMDRHYFGDFPGYQLRAYFFNGETNGVIRIVEPEESVERISDGTTVRNVYKFRIPSGNFRSVFFTNRIGTYSNEGSGTADNWKGTYPGDQYSRQTYNINLIGYGHGFTYKTNDRYTTLNESDNSYNPQLFPTSVFGMTSSEAALSNEKLYVIGFRLGYSNLSAKFDNSESITGSGANNVSTLNSSGSYNGGSYDNGETSINIIAFDKPETYNKVRIHNSDWESKTEWISKEEVERNVGKALYFTSWSNNNKKYYEYEWIQLYQTTGDNLPYNAPAPVSSTMNATYTATYQPEDRYDDADNYIYIETSDTSVKPYVMFYDDLNGSGNAIGGIKQGESAVSVGVKADKVGDTTVYRVRLPKNAKSFKIANGPVAPTADYQNLYADVSYTTAGGETITLENYHHAGSTFWIKSDCTVDTDKDTDGYTDGVKLRTGFTVGRNTSFTDPLNPRTDGDYVFFTDTDNSLANSGKVYAYFYGSADGEFKAWPGSKATTATSGNYDVATGVNPANGILEPTTYTDNDGNKVYMFRVPQGENGTYSKVIFTNGLTDVSNKITKAADLEAGKNYILGEVMQKTVSDSPRNVWYGTNAKTVYDVTVEDKANGRTQPYTTSGNKYIYIRNNGTQNAANDTESRYKLDEMHVTFFDANKNVIGSANGYIPDLVTGYYTDEGQTTWQSVTHAGDIYRIEIPSDASYFQINNGVNKGGTSKLNERYSVIEPIAENGLYKFVETADSSKLIESGTFPTTEAEKHTPKYKLTLENPLNTGEVRPIRTEYIRLAEVVSDDTDGHLGKIKKITWLKPEEGQPDDLSTVDTNYLDHKPTDINNPAVHQVKVIKKGTYYWKETEAPTNYKLNEEHLVFEYKDDGNVYYYDENNNLVKVVAGTTDMVIKNEPNPEPEGEVILTKTAKEKVGTTDIGAVLAGAEFKLVDVNETDPTKVIKFKLKEEDSEDVDGKKTNVYTVDNSGTYNVSSDWLTTGEDGRLHIKGLPVGDYYLEEQKAPAGYSEKDLTGAKRKVYFSVGANREVKEISAADEMAPAYIKLYEHISEKRSEWGDPTFVFKIKQKGYNTYNADGTFKETVDVDGKEILVALTVDDNGKIVDTVKWFGTNGSTPTKFTGDDAISSDYNNWLVEGTTELDDYQGLFNIDSKGRIRVEPGSYEITRLPVSRYEFVTNGKTAVYDNDNEPGTWAPAYTDPDTHVASEKMKLEVPKGKTIDVHYYDKVAYYDKFTQVDEEINKFYTLDSNKQNTTIKGIRIDDYKQKGNVASGDTDDSDVMTVNVADLTIYKIMADGSEVEMTPAEKAAIDSDDISIIYTFAEKDDKHFGGDSEAETPIPAQFLYDDTNKRITVTGAETFVKGVYTLKANYKGFTDEFDIVFLRETATP